MKIGTLSLNINAPDFNYGAMLHTWAFQQYLLKLDGVETEVVDYTMPKVEGWNRYDPRKSTSNYDGKKELKGTLEDYLTRARKFDDFIANNLIVSKEKYTQKTISRAELPYDIMICESDVIWAPKRGKMDPVFFLSTPSMLGKRRIAYSPSMADAILNEKQEMELEELLKNIHFISCRESYQLEILKAHTDKPVKHVVDPVMLLDPEDYDKITGPRILEEDYLLLYLPVNENRILRDNAAEYARKRNLKIVEISTKLGSGSENIDKCIPDAGMEEFLSAIKYSSAVFTNSFHAICFAVIFKKQFYAFTRRFNGKVLDVCRLFDLEDYYVFNDIFIDRGDFDVEPVYRKYRALQKEGREWLDNALTVDIPEERTDYNSKVVESMFDNTNNVYWAVLNFIDRLRNKKIKQKIRRKARAIKKIKLNADISRKTVKLNKLVESVRESTDVENNKITVSTITDSYNCNPKYICKEIIRRKLPYQITWLVNEKTDLTVFPAEIKTVLKDTAEAASEVYSSKILLDNGICFSNRYDRKDNQYHIQTMHGSLGIKKLDNSISVREKTKEGRKVISREKTKTDFILTNSTFEEEVFKNVFWGDVPMKRIGHARTDILFSDENELKTTIRNELHEMFGIPVDKKLVMYAPTHRRGFKVQNMGLDYLDLINHLETRFGGEFVVMLRLHMKTGVKLEDSLEDSPCGREFGRKIFDVKDYPDMQELMLVTDVAITDYSSWIYDYVTMRKPGFIFASDIDYYNNITGLCYPLKDTPFLLSKSHIELTRNIDKFDAEKYNDKIDAFLEAKGAMDDGHAAERAVDLIETLLG